MTMNMLLRWKNPDSSTSVNLRLKDVAAKGFLPETPSVPFVTPALGAEIIPVPFVLQVTVSPFVLVNYDGAVVLSDAPSAPLTVSDGQINYIVCRARYRLMDSPIIQMQVLTQAAYLADPELPWLHVAGVVDLSVGGPYATVPTSRIFYEARDAVDEQTRSSWREPVANSGLLPIPPADHNRHGDVRLVTSTGSLYWWNDTASLWEIFDEVPLIVHRDYEHTNGITGDSAAGTLLPGVSGAGAGSNLTIAAVPAGSAYTVDGRLLQSPAAPTSILASSVGASRGLIRVEMDFLGFSAASYRASSGTANVDYALIVNMSDAHPAGLFTLDFTALGGTLSWDNGPLVAVPVAPSGTRRYRLYRPNGMDWIEVVVNNLPAAPGINTNDIYTVTAPTDFETKFLVGYWFWDGSGAKPLIVGQDKRRFGNLAFPQMSSDFKDTQFNPPEAELRGNMVYSGGACSALVGLSLRIAGPIVSYIGGKRFETSAFFNGTAIPATSTRFIYVDEAGVLQIQIQDPATVFDSNGRPIQVAEVARVVTSGVGFTTIEDRRDPQLIIGNATRNSRVRFTGAVSGTWNQATKRLLIEGDPGPTLSDNIAVEAGSFRATAGHVSATQTSLDLGDVSSSPITGTVTLTFGSPTMTGSGTLFKSQCPPGTRLRIASQSGGLPPEDTDSTPDGFGVYVVESVTSNTVLTLTQSYAGITGATKAVWRLYRVAGAASTSNNLTYLQPLNPNSSILGVISDSKLAMQAGPGVDESAGVGIVPSFLANSVTIGTGHLYDFQGRRVEVTAPVVIDTTALANGTYDVYWDGELNGGVGGFDVGGILLGAISSHGTLSWRRSLGIGILSKVAGVNTALTECKMLAGGVNGMTGFTINSDGPGLGLRRQTNFRTLRQAMAFRCMYTFSESMPRTFNVVDDLFEPTLIDFNTFEFSGLAASQLDGLSVIGLVGGNSVNKPRVQWGVAGVASTAPLFDFQSLINSPRFENLRIVYLGISGPVDCIWVKDPGANMVVRNCGFEGSVGTAALTGLVSWSATGNLGGVAASGSSGPTLFENCAFAELTDQTEMFAINTASAFGRLLFRGCSFVGSTNVTARLVNIASATTTVDVLFDGCLINNFNSTVVQAAVSPYLGKLLISNSSIGAEAGASIGVNCDNCTFTTATNAGTAQYLTNCEFQGSINVSNVTTIENCVATGGAVVTGGFGQGTFQGCDFRTDGFFTGGALRIANCELDLGETGTITTFTTQRTFVELSTIFKSSTGVNSSRIFNVVTGSGLHLFNSLLDYNGGAGNSDSAILVSGSSWVLEIKDTTLDNGGRDIAMVEADLTGSGTCDLMLADSFIKGSTGASSVIIDQSASSSPTSRHRISNCVFTSGSAAANVATIEVSASVAPSSATVGCVEITGCHFTSSGQAPFSIESPNKLRISDNQVIYTSVPSSTAADITIGFGGGSGNALQRTLEITDNVFTLTATINAANIMFVIFEIAGYRHTTVQNNRIEVENLGTGNTTFHLNVDSATLVTNCIAMVSGNVVAVKSTSGSASSSLLLGVTDPVDYVSCNGNFVYAESASGNSTATVSVFTPIRGVINDNFIRAEGVGTCNAFLNATLASAHPGSAAGNVVTGTSAGSAVTCPGYTTTGSNAVF